MLKAIDTYYNGYFFRSRLEARWAMFFDELEIKYLYEHEGYQLSDGTLYLPDFYLPESDSFFEVKGVMTDEDMHKIKQLIADSEKAVTIGYGDMSFQACDDMQIYQDSKGFELSTKENSCLVRCRKCNKYYFRAIEGAYECPCCKGWDGGHYFDVQCFGDFNFYDLPKDVKEAFKKAKYARF